VMLEGQSYITSCLGDDGEVIDRDELERHFLKLTQEVLPRAATGADWPVRYDHCFQRVCYDNAYGDVWYQFVDDSPAYKNIEDQALLKATLFAVHMWKNGEEAVERLNQKSLYWRDEIPIWDVDVEDVNDL